MRIRKHLSGLNLPAVCNPVFRRQPNNKSSSSNNNEDMITTTGVAGGSSSTAAAAAATTAAGSSSNSQELEVAPAVAPAEKATTRILKCRTGVLKVYSSSSRSSLPNATTTTSNTNNNNDSSSASSLLSGAAVAAAAAGGGGACHNGAAPPTPTPLASRPKRTKPNACLVKGSSHTDDCMQQQEFQLEPVQEQQQEQEQVEFQQQNSEQQHRRTPLVEHIFPVIQDVGSFKQQSSASVVAGPAVEVPMQAAEEIPIERDLLLPLSKSQSHEERHDDAAAATRQAQRTRSMRKLEAVDPSSDDVNQCRRRDGKGWRCHRRTQPAYSLCEYHLDKSRETHQRKLRSTGASAGEPKRKYVRRKPVKARSLMSI